MIVQRYYRNSCPARYEYHYHQVLLTQSLTHLRCLMWFPIPRSMSKQQRMVLEVACTECAKLKNDLRRAAKRISSATPATKVQHQQAESTYLLKYLSPARWSHSRWPITPRNVPDTVIYWGICWWWARVTVCGRLTRAKCWIKSGKVTRGWHNMQHQSASKRIKQ